MLRHVGKVGYQYDSMWQNAPKVWIRGKSHRLLMELDLTNWSARNTYFLGRYYELHVLKLLDKLLKPGDRFIDIGANVGMISLHAAHLVGSTGQVDCFEPNPECQEAIKRVAQANSVNHIHVFPFGLSDQAASLELKLNHSHSGIGTLADLEHNHIVAKFTVCVKRGDDVFQKDEHAPSLIKIDVEGFEHRVVLGMQNTLDKWGCPIVMEVNENHLRRAGTTVQSLHHTMLSMGYTPFRVDLVKAGFKHSLGLIPVQTSAEVASCRDVLWVKTVPSSKQS